MADHDLTLAQRLEDIAADIGGCQVVVEQAAIDVDTRITQSILYLVEAQLWRLNDRVTEIANSAQVSGMDGASDDDEDGTPVGEIIRSAGVAMGNALALESSNNRVSILMAAANILDQAERLDPDHDGLSDWSKARELVAGM